MPPVRGRRFRTFNVVDFNREGRCRLKSIWISASSARDPCTRLRIATKSRLSGMLRMDNGPEFISLALAEWAGNMRSKTGIYSAG